MGRLVMQCFRCGHLFDLYADDIENNQNCQCPQCGLVADKHHWGRIRAGFYLCERLYGDEENVEVRLFKAFYRPGR